MPAVVYRIKGREVSKDEWERRQAEDVAPFQTRSYAPATEFQRGAEARDELIQLQNERLAGRVDWNRMESMPFATAMRHMTRNLGLVMRDGDNDYDFCRSAFSLLDVKLAFNTEVNSRMVTGYGAIRDTTAGLVRVIPAGNFLQSELAIIEETTRLRLHRKGSPAEHMSFVAKPTARRVKRYSGQLVVDQREAIDSGTTMSTASGSALLSRRNFRKRRRRARDSPKPSWPKPLCSRTTGIIQTATRLPRRLGLRWILTKGLFERQR